MTHPIIDAGTLASELERAQVFDVRWKLNHPRYGQLAYEQGHIPGATLVDLDRDLSAPPKRARHPLPTTHAFASTLGRLGISREDAVVVYDDASGRIAARMWWMMRAIGHERVQVLDGGFQAWVGAGLPVSTEPKSPKPTQYPVPERFEGVVEINDLEGRTLVDVREPERYEGVTEPVDPTPGHIPGAINIPSSSALDGGLFRAPDELAALYREATDPVMSCGSGVVACHAALAMAIAGLTPPEVYVGSYSEWSRSGRSVATGPNP